MFIMGGFFSGGSGFDVAEAADAVSMPPRPPFLVATPTFSRNLIPTMAKFKVTSGGDKSGWKATGKNPKTGREMTIRGGSVGHRGKWGTQGGKTKKQVKSFKARHGKPSSPKQYINKRNWEDGSRIGKTVNVPNRLF